jgi:hypothetical protein
VETFGLRRQAQAGRASSHGHAEEAAVVTWEQAGDERTEAEDRRPGLRPALADEKELIRRGTFQQSAERVPGSVAQSQLCGVLRGMQRRNLLCRCLPAHLINSANSVTGMGHCCAALDPTQGLADASRGLLGGHCEQIDVMKGSINQWRDRV